MGGVFMVSDLGLQPFRQEGLVRQDGGKGKDKR